MLAALGFCLLVPLVCRPQDGPTAAAAAPNPAQGKESAQRPLRVESPVDVIACSLDGKLLAWASADRLPDSANAYLVNAKTRQTIASLVFGGEIAPGAVTGARTPRKDRAAVTALAFSADGTLLAIGDRAGRVELFDTREGEHLRTISVQIEGAPAANAVRPILPRAIGSVRSLAFPRGGSQLAVCGESFADHQRTLDGVAELSSRIPDSGRLSLFDLDSGAHVRDLGPLREALQLASSPDGRTLAVLGSWVSKEDLESGLILWSTETGEPTARLSFSTSGNNASLAYSPDGANLLVRWELPNGTSSAPKQQVAWLDARTCTLLWQRELAEVSRPIGVHEEGGANFGIVLSQDGSLVFFDGDSGNTLMALRSQTAVEGGRVNCLATAKRGCCFALGGQDAEGHGVLEVLDLSGDG